MPKTGNSGALSAERGWIVHFHVTSVPVPTGSTLRFRYLAEGGMWFDDETIPAVGGGDPILAVLAQPPLTSNLAHDASVLPHGLGAVGAGLPAEPAVHGDAEVADVARRGGDPPP